jgi:hypothetical protein
MGPKLDLRLGQPLTLQNRLPLVGFGMAALTLSESFFVRKLALALGAMVLYAGVR